MKNLIPHNDFLIDAPLYRQEDADETRRQWLEDLDNPDEDYIPEDEIRADMDLDEEA
jgi:hypothetical protein